MVKKKWKDECDNCHKFKEDIHGYYDYNDESKSYVLCLSCAKKLLKEKKIKI